MEDNNIISDAMSRIKGYSNSLSNSEKKVADYVEANAHEVVKMTISDVASKAGVSDATVVRFFRTLGYKRWVEFLVSLSRSLPVSSELIYDNVSSQDSAGMITEKVLTGSIRSIQATIEVLDHTAMERFIDYLEKADTVLICAVGNSIPMAIELHLQLFRLGIRCEIFTDAYLQVMRATILNKNDVLCVISQSGGSQIPLRTASIAKSKGCKIISITGDKSSPLAGISDAILLSVGQEYKPEAINSRITQYAIIYSIYVNLVVRNIDHSVANERAIWESISGSEGL